MTQITIDRAIVEQALEALEEYAPQHGRPDDMMVAITALRAALAQEQAEPKGGGRLPPPLQAEPDLSLCPQCNGPADNGHDRSIPPSPYLCTKCMAEPVREPVAWLVMDESGYVQHAASWRDAAHEHINDAINEHDLVCARTWRVVPVYAAPPQRKPLTEEEIDKIFKHLCNTVGASYKTMTRAIERAHGIKERV